MQHNHTTDTNLSSEQGRWEELWPPTPAPPPPPPHLQQTETQGVSDTSPWPIVAIATLFTIAESIASTTGVPTSAFRETLGSSKVVCTTTDTG